mgnify:CR=1 FL=1
MNDVGGLCRRRRVLFVRRLWVREHGDDGQLAFEFAFCRHYTHLLSGVVSRKRERKCDRVIWFMRCATVW